MTVRVMHVLGDLVPHGAELRVLELLKQSCQNGRVAHHVFVVAPTEMTLLSDFESAGVVVHTSRGRLSSGLSLWRVVRRHEIDVVHSHLDLISGWVLAWAYAAHVPARVAHMRSEGVATRDRRRLSSLRDYLLKACIGVFATVVIGVSPSALRAGLIKRWPRRLRTQVMMSGIDLERLKSSPVRSPGAVVALHIGRDTAIKNRELAVDVIRACREEGLDITLYFVGETSEARAAQLRHMAGAAGQSIKFLGVRGDVPGLVAGADVTLSTSIAEGMPGVVLESALIGTPVVASDIPATRYLSGLIAGVSLVDSTAALSDWASEVRSAASRRRGPAPLESAEVASRFGIEYTAREFENLWEEIGCR